MFLSRRFGRSRTAIRQRLAGEILDVHGLPLKWSHCVRAGEILTVPALVHEEPQIPILFDILYQDESLVAVDKGPGLPVHPSRSWRTRTLVTCLRQRCNDPGIHPAHRLDRETSGVIVLGRTPEALRALMAHFVKGRPRKRYLAVVRGVPTFDRIRLSFPLGPDPDFPIRCRMRVDLHNGQPAETEVEVLERLGDRTLLSVVPRTGRQHQIRVHLAHAGFPVLGDKLYQEDGNPYLAMIQGGLTEQDLKRLGHCRHALHAESLTLPHPVSGEEQCFQAPFPEDLVRLVAGLGDVRSNPGSGCPGTRAL